MAEENKRARALQTYANVCAALDSKKWHYSKHEDDLAITCTARGDDLPIDLMIVVKENVQRLRVVSKLPFTVPEDKRVEVAVAVCALEKNYYLGGYSFDIQTGNLYFSAAIGFAGSNLSHEAIMTLIYTTCTTVDNVNDKLFAFIKGYTKLEDVLKED